VRETDKRLNLLLVWRSAFGRTEQDRVEHSILEMLSQRIYGWRWLRRYQRSESCGKILFAVLAGGMTRAGSGGKSR